MTEQPHKTDHTASGDLYPCIVQYVRDMPWAVTPGMLAVIEDLITFRAAGGHFTKAEIRERIGAAPFRAGRGRQGALAVIPLHGLIAHRADMLSETSGATSLKKFRSRFRDAVEDPQVGTILIDIDSPGGAVEGVAEAADEVLAARGVKRVVAIADTLAASAAYWIGAAAEEFVVSPSAEVGSIGVFGIHTDLSQKAEAEGVKTTLISAGRFKTEGNPFEPLSDEARAAMQSRVDEFYSMFIAAVAKGRGVKPSAVRNGFGEGRIVGARAAVAEGMADRIETFEQALTRLAPRRTETPRTRSEAYRRRLSVA